MGKGVTKGKAFVMCFCAVMVIFGSMLATGLIKDRPEVIPVAACLTAIGSLAGLYIAGSVANNGVKGANWNQDMFDSENKDINMGG
jgi:hypothetical protein